MFSDILDFPIDLLRNAAIWDDSIEKLMPLRAFKVYRFCIRYIFVYVAVICETVHLKAYESFEVWIYDPVNLDTENFHILHFILDILWQFLNRNQHL